MKRNSSQLRVDINSFDVARGSDRGVSELQPRDTPCCCFGAFFWQRPDNKVVYAADYGMVPGRPPREMLAARATAHAP